ncbi:unnamed protein product [Linum tenue]|uniref:cyclin-dependent kinase n=1 Tax=Linum tenue TaxID=586396 RepID=A0AAV0PFS1_9ROSI|nr:unnamed protein product [Linum tenue]
MRKIYVDDMNDIAAVMREVTPLMDLKHPNTVRLLDVLIHSNRVELVSEHLDCDLLKYLEKPERITQPQIKEMLRQILKGLASCHSKNLVHGNLTPKSLLIDCKSGTVKLSVFGLTSINNVVSHHSHHHHHHHHQRLHPDPGGEYTTWEMNAAYMAPEVLLGREGCSFAADVWSVGCILALMLTRQHLFAMKGNELGGQIPSQLDHMFRIRGSPEWLLGNASSNYQLQDLTAKLNFGDSAGLDLIKVSHRICFLPIHSWFLYSLPVRRHGHDSDEVIGVVVFHC